MPLREWQSPFWALELGSGGLAELQANWGQGAQACWGSCFAVQGWEGFGTHVQPEEDKHFAV